MNSRLLMLVFASFTKTFNIPLIRKSMMVSQSHMSVVDLLFNQGERFPGILMTENLTREELA